MNEIKEGLTFDDVLLLPAYSEVAPSAADVRTRLTASIELNIPLLSAAMDTVTEAKLAIALAQEGGIGVIHKNMAPEQQAEQVRRVKKYESGIIADPITVAPTASVREVAELTRAHRISGVPVVEGAQLVGIVTHRDLRFQESLDQPVSALMTPREKLVTVREGTKKSEVLRLLHKHRIEKMPVVDGDFELRGLITVKDFQKSSEYPNACRDRHGRLRVGAAVGVGDDARARAERLVEAEADALVVDTAHGHSKAVLDAVAALRRAYADLQIVAGNIVSGEAASALIDAGASAVKVGVGPGSICTTRIVAGVGVPQITAIMEVRAALDRAAGADVTLVADGGVRFSGDVVKALAAGADCVMLGGLFAATLEAPGKVESYQGRSYKTYRGMGSLAAMQAGAGDRYFRDAAGRKSAPEGVEGRVPYRGSVTEVATQLVGGLRSGLGYVGCKTLPELRKRRRFVRVTRAGLAEGHAHDVAVTREAPNYRVL